MHQIPREKQTTSEILSKIGIGFISNVLLKARVLYLTILKRENLSLPLKVETDQFVICLVLPECLSVKICCISPSIVTALMPSLLFRCFSLFLPHLRTLAQEKRSENCLRFGTGVPSLCLYPLSSRKILFFPTLTMAVRAKKNLAKRFAHAIDQRALLGFWARLITYTEFDCAALLAML